MSKEWPTTGKDVLLALLAGKQFIHRWTHHIAYYDEKDDRIYLDIGLASPVVPFSLETFDPKEWDIIRPQEK